MIAISPQEVPRTNHHLQLTYLFENYAFYRDHHCWLQRLGTADRAGLEARFSEVVAAGDLTAYWRTDQREGRFPLRALLDPARFPDGPQLCYAPGTDVRDGSN